MFPHDCGWDFPIDMVGADGPHLMQPGWSNRSERPRASRNSVIRPMSCDLAHGDGEGPPLAQYGDGNQ